VNTVQFANEWSKAGVMMRAGTGTGARNVFALMAADPAKQHRLQVRNADGGTTAGAATAGSGAAGVMFKLVRQGNTFTATFSNNNGMTWNPLGSTTVTMPATFNVGMAVTSHTLTGTAMSNFDMVSITQP
jgi:hypothetical protein